MMVVFLVQCRSESVSLECVVEDGRKSATRSVAWCNTLCFVIACRESRIVSCFVLLSLVDWARVDSRMFAWFVAWLIAVVKSFCIMAYDLLVLGMVTMIVEVAATVALLMMVVGMLIM